MISASPSGTNHFRDRHLDLPGNYGLHQGLWLSSIGLGTYLGQPDRSTDQNYTEAIILAIELGCNVIDTASNYRFQRSERAIGVALQKVFADHKAAREEIVISTKGGYIPFESEYPHDAGNYIRDKFVKPGLAKADEIVDGHCLAPNFLHGQLEQSRFNLGLDCIDIYYVHNPESQLEFVKRKVFRDRLRAAFLMLEEAVESGLIKFYGTATWNGYRNPIGATEYLSLEEVLSVAREIGGIRHHCRFIQLPYNLAMLEAITARNQRVAGEMMSILEAAEMSGVTVMCSAPLLQARLLNQLPEGMRHSLTGLTTDAQRCLQLVRSTPNVAVALTGMSHVKHVEENMATAQVAPLTLEQIRALLTSTQDVWITHPKTK
jgi:aryl-alcohol dehydrogenase-like predicted oxidoreductase